MNINELPDDALRAVFRQLDGRCVQECRKVCQHWLATVDSLGDSDWAAICSNDRDVLAEEYRRVRHKYGMSWRDTYRAIHTWKDIASYGMTSHTLCEGDIQSFKVIPNGQLAVLQNKRHKGQRFTREEGRRQIEVAVSDTLTYYNTETLEVCNEEEFDGTFCDYDENEHMIVLGQYNSRTRMCIIIKENKQKFAITDVYDTFCQFKLIGKEVYHRNTDDIIFVSKLTNINGVPTVKSEIICKQRRFKKNLITFCVKNGDLHLFEIEGWEGDMRAIYVYKNNHFDEIDCYNGEQQKLFYSLKENGFDWRSEPIISWVLTERDYTLPFYGHGMTIITTGKTDHEIRDYNYNLFHRLVVRIYYDRYSCGQIAGLPNLLRIFRYHPQRKIDIREQLPNKSWTENSSVSQVDIIETINEHKVLILVDGVLLVTKFSVETKGNKRKRGHKSE